MIQSTGLSYRDKVRQQLLEITRAASTDVKWAFECAMRLESELYRLFVSGKPYCDKCRSLLFNLQDENNKRPLEMLLDHQISPEEFIRLDVREMASEEMKKQREQFEEMGMWQKRTDWDNEEVKA